MGTVHKFERPPRNRRRFSGRTPVVKSRPSASARLSGAWRKLCGWQRNAAVWALLIGVAAGLASTYAGAGSMAAGEAGAFRCANAIVVDGDTLRCADQRVRLYGIDAPELPGHCRRGRRCVPGDPYASSENLRRLIAGAPLVCRPMGMDHYGRVVARCSAAGRDLSCGQLQSGQAQRRYGALWC